MQTENRSQVIREEFVYANSAANTASDAAVPNVLLVTSADWIGFARMPRVLKRAGARVTAMGLKKSLLSTTKFVEEFLPVAGTPDEVRDQLLAHLAAYPTKYAWVCIGDDPLFRAVSLSDDPSIASWFPIERTDALRDFIESKWVFMARCAEAGLHVAPFEVCQNLEQARAAAARIGFPLVVKLMQSIGASGVLPAYNQAEFEKILASNECPVALQAFVNGIPFATEVLYDRGVPVCWTSSEQINRWPRLLGPSSARRTIHVEATEHVVRTIGKITGFHGICAIDAILPSDGGTPMMCELNPRPTPGHTADEEARGLYANALAGFLRREAVAPFTQKRSAPRLIAMFPESLYYLVEKPLEPMRWGFAVRGLLNAPLVDRRMVGHIARHFAVYVVKKNRPRAALRAIVAKLTGRKPQSNPPK